MFALRSFIESSGVETVDYLGNHYQVIAANSPRFDELCKGLRGEDVLGVIQNDKVSIRLFKGTTYYVISEGGKTVDCISKRLK